MSKRTRIKICGITTEEEAGFLNEAGVDYAGFVFYEKSKRNVSTEQVKKIMKVLDKEIKRVAVTVSPDITLIKTIEETGFDILQVHGELDEDVLKAVSIPVWRAINLQDTDKADEMLNVYGAEPDDLNDKIRGILMDAPDFGSGKTFDWHKSKRLLKAGDRSSPFGDKDFILAGGLDPDNVTEGIRIFAPDVVDVSSGVEGEKGKSEKKIQEFVKAVNKGE